MTCTTLRHRDIFRLGKTSNSKQRDTRYFGAVIGSDSIYVEVSSVYRSHRRLSICLLVESGFIDIFLFYICYKL